MSLALEVGRLARLVRAGEDARAFEAEIERANAALLGEGLVPHREPADLEPDATCRIPLVSDIALHPLRRLAAHLWTTGRLPAPAGEDDLVDFAVEEYYAALEDEALGAFWERARADRGEPGFEHLMLHADDGGLWLPADFDLPVRTDAGEFCGSAPALARELALLCRALELEPTRSPDDPEVRAALGDPEADWTARPGRWRRYGALAHTCLALLEACSVARVTRAAVVLVSYASSR